MKIYKISLVILYLLLLTVINCIGPPHKPIHPAILNENVRLKALEDIEKSVVKITCSSYYKNYFYNYPQTLAEKIAPIENRIYNENITSNSVAGTGFILHQSSARQIILTCYHIFDFADTLRTYYYDANKKPTKYLSSFSTKSAQKIYVFHKNGSRSIGSIIVVDDKNDLALIETSPGRMMLTEYAYEGYFGKSNSIKLGEEVHLLGFPKGFFMVSRGLASPSNFRNKFMVDTSFNRGFSGGVVLRFVDTDPYYEFIGMANSVAYTAENVLIPGEDDPQLVEQYKSHPYDGPMYIKDLKTINYGLTFVIRTEIIKQFLEDNAFTLKERGLNVSKFYR